MSNHIDIKSIRDFVHKNQITGNEFGSNPNEAIVVNPETGSIICAKDLSPDQRKEASQVPAAIFHANHGGPTSHAVSPQMTLGRFLKNHAAL